jgi:uncharacterized protein (TIGR00369 family)
MQTAPNDPLGQLRAANASAAFNRWAGVEVAAAEPGRAVLRMRWRDEFGQYSGHLHVGLICALIDTACGFAASTISGPVVATHGAVDFIAPGIGEVFEATGTTVKTGRRQIFATAELRALRKERSEALIATGQVLMIPVA